MIGQVAHLNTCTGHRAALYALAPGGNSRKVLSAGGDGWIVEWDLDEPENGRLLASVETQIFALSHVPGQGWIIAGDMNGGLHWINLSAPDKNRDVQHHHKGVYDLLPVGPSLYSVGGDGVLSRWSLETTRVIESIQVSNQSLRALARSAGHGHLAVGASDHNIYILDEATMAIRRTLTGAHGNSVFAVAYSPDGRYLLSGGRDAMLRVWDVANDYALISEQPAHWYTVNHIVYSPDGTLFATASRDKTCRIWNAGTFELVRTIDTIRDGGHINSVNKLLWLPDALVSASDDRTMMLWSVN